MSLYCISPWSEQTAVVPLPGEFALVQHAVASPPGSGSSAPDPYLPYRFSLVIGCAGTKWLVRLPVASYLGFGFDSQQDSLGEALYWATTAVPRRLFFATEQRTAMGITYTKKTKKYTKKNILPSLPTQTMAVKHYWKKIYHSPHAVDHKSRKIAPLPPRQGDLQYQYKVLCVFQLMKVGGLGKMVGWECMYRT